MAGVKTFLFTDVEGSTRLWERDPAAMSADLARHDAIVRHAIQRDGGVVFSTAGDAFAAAFADPLSALRCAVDVQRSLAQVVWTTEGIRVRMALHSGSAEERDGDFFGVALNRTARLLASGHGGQILVSAACHELVVEDAEREGIGFVGLGRHRLKDLERPEQIFQIVSESLASTFPPLSSVEAHPNNLPSLFSSFIGREAELQRIEEALAQSRMVTVTGPGGVGKSRTALELAARQLDRFVDGVWFVELAPITDPLLLCGEVLRQLKLSNPISKDAVQALVDGLEDRSMLVILDNSEHVVAHVAWLVRTLLEAAPEVRVLCTSRQPLGLTGEVVSPLPPMSVGDGTERPLDAEAVRLFVDRAPSPSRIGNDDLVAVQRICRRLDGLPLAIELATARLQSMSLEDLDRRLDDRFRVLRSRDPTARPHHRTLSATVDWSYELLDEAGQEAYRRLSVFRASFDLDAAEAVAASARVDEADVLDVIESLVCQSLLVQQDGPGATRYRMLQTMRDHASGYLVQLDESGDAHAALLRWAMRYAQAAGRGLQGPEQQRWIERVVVEVDNLRGALDWALEHDPVSGLRITTALSIFWWLHGVDRSGSSSYRATSYLAEGAARAEAMLAAAGEDVPPALRARAQMTLGGLLQVRLGRFSDAVDRLDESLAIFAGLHDERSEGWATYYRTVASWNASSEAEVLDGFKRAGELFRRTGDVGGEAYAEMMLTLATIELGRTVEAAAHLERCSSLVEQSPIPTIAAHVADSRALLAASAGEEADPADIALALEGFIELGQFACLAHTVETLALYHERLGEPVVAATLLGIAAGFREQLGMVVPNYERRAWMVEQAAWAEAEPSARAAAFRVGETMSLDAAIEAIRGFAR